MSTQRVNNNSHVRKRSLQHNDQSENDNKKTKTKQEYLENSTSSQLYSAFSPFFNSLSDQEYMQKIVDYAEKDITVNMVTHFKTKSIPYARRQGTLINQLIDVARKSSEELEGMFTFLIREADFFCYDLDSGHSEEVCKDSHHIHIYVCDLNIKIHAKFYDNKERIYVTFTLKDLLSFNEKKEKYMVNNRLLTLPADLRQILSWFKQTFNQAIRNNEGYFEDCY